MTASITAMEQTIHAALRSCSDSPSREATPADVVKVGECGYGLDVGDGVEGVPQLLPVVRVRGGRVDPQPAGPRGVRDEGGGRQVALVLGHEQVIGGWYPGGGHEGAQVDGPCEQVRRVLLEEAEHLNGELADFDFRVAAGTLLDEVPQGAGVAGDEDFRLRGVGQHARPGSDPVRRPQ